MTENYKMHNDFCIIINDEVYRLSGYTKLQYENSNKELKELRE